MQEFINNFEVDSNQIQDDQFRIRLKEKLLKQSDLKSVYRSILDWNDLRGINFKKLFLALVNMIDHATAFELASLQSTDPLVDLTPFMKGCVCRFGLHQVADHTVFVRESARAAEYFLDFIQTNPAMPRNCSVILSRIHALIDSGQIETARRFAIQYEPLISLPFIKSNLAVYLNALRYLQHDFSTLNQDALKLREDKPKMNLIVPFLYSIQVLLNLNQQESAVYLLTSILQRSNLISREYLSKCVKNIIHTGTADLSQYSYWYSNYFA